MTVRSVELTDRALRDFARLDRSVAKRIAEKLERAVRNPERFLSRIVGSDECKLRVGDYRLLAVLSYETKTIIVGRVDHRSRIYDRR